METQSFDNFYNEFLSGINHPEVSSSDLVAMTINAMTVVQKDLNLSGADKKQYVIDIISKFVNDNASLPPEAKPDADAFIRNTLPELIDHIVATYKHEIQLGPRKSGQQGCCTIF